MLSCLGPFFWRGRVEWEKSSFPEKVSNHELMKMNLAKHAVSIRVCVGFRD